MNREMRLRSEIAELQAMLARVKNPDRELLHSMHYLRLLINNKQRRLAAMRQTPAVAAGDNAA